MENAPQNAPKPTAEDKARAELAKLMARFIAIPDYAERKAFYLAHPELAAVFSPVNFHA